MRTTRILRATDIIGDIIINKDNEPLGFIDDLMVDVQKGTVKYVVLGRGGILGLGKKFIAIPMELLEPDPYGKGYILDIDSDAVDRAPEIDKDNWPEMVTMAWRRKISEKRETKSPM